MSASGQCIAVVSGKGGTGKTSFVAGVGAALAMSGRKVLCLDRAGFQPGPPGDRDPDDLAASGGPAPI